MAASVPAGFRVLPLAITQLSLAAVLQCGQSFRWTIYPLASAAATLPENILLPTHEYRFCLRDRVVCLRQSPDALFYRPVYPDPQPSRSAAESKDAETLDWIRDYFQLDIDLVRLYEQWSNRDPVLHRFKDRFGGIRMLRQDPFETLLSFICSSNNNISRITKMVKSLCREYSPPLLSIPPPTLDSVVSTQAGAELYHPFPPPSVLAAPEVTAKLRELGFGYRADFIQKTAKMLVDTCGTNVSERDRLEPAEKWLLILRTMDTSEAREQLLKFMGVGRKVADCILLMSLDKNEVIPVDTHVHQIAAKYYGLKSVVKGKATMSPKLYEEVSTKLAAVWGEYAGWAHSVLFTSDLKAFSDYGLPSPSPTPSAYASPRKRESLVTHRQTRSPGPNKRKRAVASQATVAVSKAQQVAEGLSHLEVKDEPDSSMIDRVKRRRRTVVVKVS